MALRNAASLFRQTRSLAPLFQRTGPQFQFFSAKADAEGDLVKDAFVKQQSQLRSYLEELAKVKIPLDAANEKAVKEFADAKKKIRQKLGVPSATEKLNDLLEAAAEDSETVRSFMEKSSGLRQEFGIADELGAEPLLFEALDGVESKLGKPLTLSDTKGLQAWQEAVTAVNKKLGLSENDLEKLESDVEYEMVKAEVAKMSGEAEEKISTYKRRDGLAVKVDLKEIDPRAYL